MSTPTDAALGASHARFLRRPCPGRRTFDGDVVIDRQPRHSVPLEPLRRRSWRDRFRLRYVWTCWYCLDTEVVVESEGGETGE